MSFQLRIDRLVEETLTTQYHIKICSHGVSIFKWRHNFIKFYRKRNAHRFWTARAIKTIDSSLGRYLIVDFKIREFVGLRVYNFADVTSFKYKISVMRLRWWGHKTLGSYESKVFLLQYFSISLGEVIKSPRNRKVASKQCQFYSTTPLPSPCKVKIKNDTQSKRYEIFLK